MNDEALNEYSTAQAVQTPEAVQTADAAPAPQSPAEQHNQNPVSEQPAVKPARTTRRNDIDSRRGSQDRSAIAAITKTTDPRKRLKPAPVRGPPSQPLRPLPLQSPSLLITKPPEHSRSSCCVG
jgi:hypothetical protein